MLNPADVSDMKAEVMKLTGGKGMNQVFIACTAPAVYQSAADMLRFRGQIVLVGLLTKEVPVLPVSYCLPELNLQGILIYTDEFPIVLDLLKQGTLPVTEIITKIKLSDIVSKGFDPLLNPDCDEAKILVSPE